MIRRLDDVTIGQIAAGEVIERPASVVKELVENALDAGARTIAVAIVRGGLDRIEVGDDGAGIPRDDLALALQRHATSKLDGAAGLERVTTLGFRGEGLASIVAVAGVSITSRTGESDVGYRIDADALSTTEPRAAASPPGTRVTVDALFSNVPVRREFLRSIPAEFARISTLLATLALGYPQVRFSLAHDDREVWVFPSAASIEQRLAHLFGPAAARGLTVLDGATFDGGAVRGFISTPGYDRPDRRMQLLFVNGRLLRSTLLAGAWSAGYATFAMSGRQPYGVLFMDLAPDRVDPNVHPTKSDVRLRDGVRASDAVKRAIVATLQRRARSGAAAALGTPPAAASPLIYAASPAGATANGAPDPVAAPQLAVSEPAALRVLAQLDETYILATDGDALVLVDQHAAHERVAFESIARRNRATRACEPLLVPYTVELDPAQAERFEATRDALADAGFEAEPFGERTYRVLATPAGYGARTVDVAAYLADLADDIAGLDARERIWASLACHSVVRAGEPLEHAEMSALLVRLARCENPMHCPHGRPTIVRIEPDAIARMFKRA